VERVIGVTLTALAVESVPVVFGQRVSLCETFGQVRVGDKPPTNSDSIGVTTLDRLGSIGVIVRAAGNQGSAGGHVTERSQGEDCVGLAMGLNDICQLVHLHLIGGEEITAGLDQVDVRQAARAELADRVAVVRNDVAGLGALEESEGAEPDTDSVGADGRNNGIGDLDDEARAVLGASTVFVGTDVDVVANELVKEIAVGGVDLDTVEAGGDGALGRVHVVGDGVVNVLLGHLPRINEWLRALGRPENHALLALIGRGTNGKAATEVIGVGSAPNLQFPVNKDTQVQKGKDWNVHAKADRK
jgi:hypothetical protein